MSSVLGKKQIIFDEALKLISLHGFETVNLRHLAKLSGIKAASIYNHFSSKQEILDAVYTYFEEHFLDNLKEENEIKRIIEFGSKDEIINALTFHFESDDLAKQTRMILCTKIIFARYFTDKRASNIFYNLMKKEREEHTAKLLDYGILIGRFSKFDTKAFAFILISSMHAIGMQEFCKEDYTVRLLEDDRRIKNMFKELLPFKQQ